MLLYKKRGRPAKRPSKEEFEMLYPYVSAKELAAKYGVNEQTIRNWASQFRKEEQNS